MRNWSVVLFTLAIRISLIASFLFTMNQSPRSVLVGNIETSSAGLSTISNKMALASGNDGRATDLHYARSLLFELASLVGDLSSAFLRKVPLDPPLEETSDADSAENKPKEGEPFSISRPNAIEDEEVSRAMATILLKLIELGHSLSLKLGTVIVKKMQLNERKYPADLCRGKSGKYLQYSSVTGITKDEGQSTLHIEANDEEETVLSFLESLEQLTQDIGSFASERQWTRFHKPRNLVLALLGELGELAELFQWRGDTGTVESISKENMDKVGQELADVTIYLIRLSDVCHIDLNVHAQTLLEGPDQQG